MLAMSPDTGKRVPCTLARRRLSATYSLPMMLNLSAWFISRVYALIIRIELMETLANSVSFENCSWTFLKYLCRRAERKRVSSARTGMGAMAIRVRPGCMCLTMDS